MKQPARRRFVRSMLAGLMPCGHGIATATAAPVAVAAAAAIPHTILVGTASGGAHDWWLVPLASEMRENGVPVELRHLPDADGALALDLVASARSAGWWLAVGSDLAVRTSIRRARGQDEVSRALATLTLGAGVSCPWVWVEAVHGGASGAGARASSSGASSSGASGTGPRPSSSSSSSSSSSGAAPRVVWADPECAAGVLLRRLAASPAVAARLRCPPPAAEVARATSGADAAASLDALRTRRADRALLPLGIARQAIAEGWLRALTVSSPERLDGLPDVPTFAEWLGRDAATLAQPAWFGLVGPAAPVDSRRLRAQLAQGLATPEMRGFLRWSAAFAEPAGQIPDASRLEREALAWRAAAPAATGRQPRRSAA